MSAPAGAGTVTLAPIAGEDAKAVGIFLHEQLNPRVPASSWEALVHPPWAAESPNHGFQLLDAEGQIAGAYVAVYSTREDGTLSVCNLAAFCVLPEHRMHSLRLVRALLKQRGYLFTDLSPSGNVPAMNDRLGFTRLDTATRLVANLPGRVRGAAATEDPAQLARTLRDGDLQIYQDHRDAPAARHLLVRDGGGHAYLVYRRDRRRRMPLFASPLHVGGDPLVLERAWPVVSAHLLRQRLPATLAERRVLGFTPPGPGRELTSPRVKMYKGILPPGREVDYLYSEMALLRW